MNPIFRKQNIIALAISAVLLTGMNSRTVAQNDFSLPSHRQTIRDHAVAPADFQQELDQSLPEVAQQLYGSDNAQDLSTLEVAIDQETAGTSATSSLLEELANQSQNIQMPKVFGSLAIVIGGYLGFVWLTRRISGTSNHGLPTEVVEILGQTPFGQRKNLQLVRLGSKLLLLMNHHDGTTQTIGEITDPHEVDYLASICGKKNNSRSAIAISKATSSSNRNDSTGNELTRVLRQLQKAGESNSASTVFDA